jgi:flagellar basal-body rod modification protein FlgD
MNIAPLNPTANSRPAAGAGRDGGLFANFEDFLRLLTTQLQQQDPLTPMDSEKFTQQLVEFAAVEQASRTNDRLAKLIDTVAAGQLLTAAGYVGREVEFAGDTLFLGEAGEARIAYSLPRTAASAELVVRSEKGEEITRRSVPAGAGSHSVVWDGRDARGLRVPPGTYRVEIVAADGAGTPIAADLRTAGVVDAVFFENDTLLLSAGGLRRPASSVTAVRAGAA